jgi:hypothetical protein
MAKRLIFRKTPALNFLNVKPDGTQEDFDRAFDKIVREHPPEGGRVNRQIVQIATVARNALRNYDPERIPDDYKRERNLFKNFKKALEFAARMEVPPKVTLEGCWLWIRKRTWPAANDHLIPERSKWKARPKTWDLESQGILGWYSKPRHGAGSGAQGLAREADDDSRVTRFYPGRGSSVSGGSGGGFSAAGSAARSESRMSDRGPRRQSNPRPDEDEEEINMVLDDEVAEEEE